MVSDGPLSPTAVAQPLVLPLDSQSPAAKVGVYGLDGRLSPLADPRTAREFVFIDDLCETFILAVAQTQLERGTILNFGRARQTSLDELVALVRSELAIVEQPRWATMRRGCGTPPCGWPTARGSRRPRAGA